MSCCVAIVHRTELLNDTGVLISQILSISIGASREAISRNDIALRPGRAATSQGHLERAAIRPHLPHDAAGRPASATQLGAAEEVPQLRGHAARRRGIHLQGRNLLATNVTDLFLIRVSRIHDIGDDTGVTLPGSTSVAAQPQSKRTDAPRRRRRRWMER